MGNIHTVGPNEALIISGGCFGDKKVKTIVGGWGWSWWLVCEVQMLSLEVMTLTPKCEQVETSEGVPITVTGVAQVKVLNEENVLHIACEQFLGKKREDIANTILQTLEGHLRAILGTLTVEAVYQVLCFDNEVFTTTYLKDRDQFAQLVREVASPDVSKMGIEILSFTIKDVYDKVEYLNSLGRAQTANVKKDADIGVAEAERDAGIREAECEKLRMNIRYQANTEIADAERNFNMQKAIFETQVNQQKAESELAYELQAAKEKQKIRTEEIQIEVVEKNKQILIEESEVLRRENDLIASIKKPAESEAYKIERVSEGLKEQQIYLAKADAMKIELKGEAEAFVIGEIGKAEALRMKLRAGAFKKYGKTAILNQIIDSMPRVAAEVTSPLQRTKNITIIDGGAKGSLVSEIAQIIGSLPPTIEAITGVDITNILAKIPGAEIVK